MDKKIVNGLRVRISSYENGRLTPSLRHKKGSGLWGNIDYSGPYLNWLKEKGYDPYSSQKEQ